MPLSGKKVVQLLTKRGWVRKGQRGSHVKLEKDGVVIVVPVHGNNDLGRGLLRAIEKQSGETLR